MRKILILMCVLLVALLLTLPVVGCTKPLTLTMRAPTDGATIDTSPVEVRGYVSDSKATVWVNNTQVKVSKSGGKWYFSTNVELAEGENTIKVTAARGKPDNWKDTVAKTVAVTYSPK